MLAKLCLLALAVPIAVTWAGTLDCDYVTLDNNKMCDNINLQEDSEAPTSLTFSELTFVNSLYLGPKSPLISAKFPKTFMFFMNFKVEQNEFLTELSVPIATSIKNLEVTDNLKLKSLSFPGVSTLKGSSPTIHNNPALTSISLPMLSITPVPMFLADRGSPAFPELFEFDFCSLYSAMGEGSIQTGAGMTVWLPEGSNADVPPGTVKKQCLSEEETFQLALSDFDDDKKCPKLSVEAQEVKDGVYGVCGAGDPCETVKYIAKRVRYWQGEYAKLEDAYGYTGGKDDHHERLKNHYIERIQSFCGLYTPGMSSNAELGVGVGGAPSTASQLAGGVFGAGVVLTLVVAVAVRKNKAKKVDDLASTATTDYGAVVVA